MNKVWWCADCRIPTKLDRHGRCDTCGSDAVDSMERINLLHKPAMPFRPADAGVAVYVGAGSLQ